MRPILAALFLPGLLSAAMLPTTVGPWQGTVTAKAALADRPVWDEYGLKAWETVTYKNGTASFTLTVWQLQDTTGSLAAFDWQRPAEGKPSKAAPLASETKDGLVWVHGQYVLASAGHKPDAAEIAAVNGALKSVDTTPLPVLPTYLPAENLVPNSERYITGAASLQKFVPAIAPSVAGFHLGAEAQLGSFRSSKGEMQMAIFNYPTPQIAMQKFSDFEKAGAMAKRSGPFVAVFVAPADADLAERLLGQVRYHAEITRDEYVPTKRDNMGDLLLNICILTGLLVAFATLSGLMLGGFRAAVRMFRKGEEPEVMISLHLD